jgi:hypothetical protein
MISKITALSLALSQLPASGVAAAPATANVIASQTIATDSSAPYVDYSNLPGFREDTYSLEVTPGSGPTGLRWGDKARAVWGSSYAISTETLFLFYQGKAKAAGNVHFGERFVQVCIWYSRSNQPITTPVCSNARSTSTAWVSGPEVGTSAWDSLGWNDPKTYFNISTVRISPTVF